MRVRTEPTDGRILDPKLRFFRKLGMQKEGQKLMGYYPSKEEQSLQEKDQIRRNGPSAESGVD
jgi:hypothetical protein